MQMAMRLGDQLPAGFNPLRPVSNEDDDERHMEAEIAAAVVKPDTEAYQGRYYL